MLQDTDKSTKNSPQIPPIFGQNIICGKHGSSCILWSKEGRNRRPEKAKKGPSPTIRFEDTAKSQIFVGGFRDTTQELRVLQVMYYDFKLCSTIHGFRDTTRVEGTARLSIDSNHRIEVYCFRDTTRVEGTASPQEHELLYCFAHRFQRYDPS